MAALVLAASLALTLAVYAPALGLELRSDDYDWAWIGRQAGANPLLLATDLGGFFRPTNTATFLLDRWLSGDDATGYHVTNLLLHALAGLGLWIASRRLGLSWVAASLVSLLWVASPFAEEPAVWASARFQCLLFLCWTVVIAAWPRGAEGWSAGRRIAVWGALVLAAATKESWVVLPALGLALELGRERFSWRRTVTTLAPMGLFAGAYVLLYFVLLPGDKNYYAWKLSTLVKLPHMLAAFLYLEELRPLAFEATWAAGLALAITAACVVAGLRGTRAAASRVGLSVLLLATLPVLFVAYLPTRYTYIPYAGFLLLVAGAVEAVLHRLPRRAAPVARWTLAALVAIVLVAGVVTVRADLVDFARVSQATTRLLDETRRAVPALAVGTPVLVVRADREQPLAEITRSPHGRAKIWYRRAAAPYGMVEPAPLFDWVLPAALTARRIDGWERTLAGVPGLLLLHEDGGFRLPPAPLADVAAEGLRLRAEGYGLQVVRVEPLAAAGRGGRGSS